VWFQHLMLRFAPRCIDFSRSHHFMQLADSSAQSKVVTPPTRVAPAVSSTPTIKFQPPVQEEEEEELNAPNDDQAHHLEEIRRLEEEKRQLERKLAAETEKRKQEEEANKKEQADKARREQREREAEARTKAQEAEIKPKAQNEQELVLSFSGVHRHSTFFSRSSSKSERKKSRKFAPFLKLCIRR
jgi:hypothetical protein